LEGFFLMANKYDGINRDNPQEAAMIVGHVEKSNYLAHTIREIELAIHKKYGTHYHIVTHTSDFKIAKIFFHPRSCTIRLPNYLCENKNDRDRRIRLVLAHELGHLVYNIYELKNPAILNWQRKVPIDEEIYAWTFAYFLVDKKSGDHKSDRRRDKFVYDYGELKESLTFILDEQVAAESNEGMKRQKQEIRDATLHLIKELKNGVTEE
jgi:hypothetical protein